MANIIGWSWIRCNGIFRLESFVCFCFFFNFNFGKFQHTDPDYSCAYVVIKTNDQLEGIGLTFTCGRGTEIVKMACKALSILIVDRHLKSDIYSRFGPFWREVTSETQLRWVNNFFCFQFQSSQMVSKIDSNFDRNLVGTRKRCDAFGCCRSHKCFMGFMGKN